MERKIYTQNAWWMIMIGGIVGALLVAGAAGAASDTASVNGVPEQLELMQLSIDAVQNSVNGVAAHINAIIPSNQSQTRFTPPIVTFSHSSELFCSVVNVAPFRRSIHVGAVRGDGTLHPASVTIPLDPGTATSVGPIVIGVSTWWCRFTVQDGSRTDIRAAISLEDAETRSRITLAAE